LGNAELYSYTPHPSQLELPGDKSAGILKKTITSVTKSYLPKHVKKVNKYLPPVHELDEDAPPITEDDINRGMMELVNKGIIPKDVDLTPAFEKGAAPVSVRGMKFFEKS